MNDSEDEPVVERIGEMRLGSGRRDFDVWEKRILAELTLRHHSCSKIPIEYRRGGKIRVKSDVDFVASIEGSPVWFDAKKTNDPVWNIKEYVTHATKIHQWAKLQMVWDNGDHAGYLLWMSTLDLILWVPVEAIEFALKNHHASIHPKSDHVRYQKAELSIDFKALFFGDTRDNQSLSPFAKLSPPNPGSAKG